MTTQIDTPLTESQRAEIEVILSASDWRSATIKAIRSALKARSGKAWSVTGGRGTAYGWIKVEAPPARCTWTSVPKPDNVSRLPGIENWDEVDTNQPGGCMGPYDRELLGTLLGLGKPTHRQGESIPASTEYRRLYLARALFGTSGGLTASPYWD